MYVRHLRLDQFRTYEHLDLALPSQGLRISGRNASGKTSILEALVMMSTTRSPRTTTDRDVVRWNSGDDYGVRPYARIEALVEMHNGPRQVGINVELDAERQALVRKQFLLNGDQVRAHDLIGVMKCVLFSPEDVLLVSGAPSERRRQIDILISQIERSYLHALTQYGKILTQRNQLLKRFARERRTPRDAGAVNEISFWDEEIVAAGSMVMAHRYRVVNRVSALVTARSAHLVHDVEIGFRYLPKLVLPQDNLPDDPDRHQIAAAFTSAIESARPEEFRRGVTVIGPHRDDFVFLIEGRELASYGSRGQQRLGVVAYRLAEMDIIDEISGERPILLLDDVLSELDSFHRDLLLTAVTDCDCQILVTSTDASTLDHAALGDLPAAVIRDGCLSNDGAS
ncbi:MAG: DNA replication and repair protein RecF [Chloroflexota bacterium]|nr:DNA replication and repair protein RecF [Chloroflexota bacterium]